MGLLPELSLIMFLLGLSAFFAGTETALFSLSKIERRRVEQSHPWFSHLVSEHLNHPRRTLIAITLGNHFVNILSAAIVTLLAMKQWGPKGVSVVVTVYTILLIIIGEIMPKVWAVRTNEAFTLFSSFPLRLFCVVSRPLLLLMQSITDGLLNLMTSGKKEPSKHISEDELLAMVKVSEKDGVLDRQERYMIQKLFELGEKSANDIMTPRIDLKGLDIEETREEHMEIMRQYHYSYFPVYRESMDHILGVVSAQAYILREDKELVSLMFQPRFVPETKRIDDLLAEFKEKKRNFAVCLDEYGGTAGIVTLEDILEEIFGEFYDEYAQVENPVRPFGHREYLVEAKMSLADFNEYFSTNYESEEANTLGGYILEELGEIPSRGKILKLPGCEIRIQEVIRRRRIRKVIVKMDHD